MVYWFYCRQCKKFFTAEIMTANRCPDCNMPVALFNVEL